MTTSFNFFFFFKSANLPQDPPPHLFSFTPAMTVYTVCYTAIQDAGWLTKYSHPHFFSSYNEFISVLWFLKNIIFSNSNIRFLYTCSALPFKVFRIEWIDKTLFFSGNKNYLYTLKCLTNYYLFIFLKTLMYHLYNSKLQLFISVVKLYEFMTKR